MGATLARPPTRGTPKLIKKINWEGGVDINWQLESVN